TFVGEGEHPLAVAVFPRDQALVLEHLQRRVDGARTRAPPATATGLQLRDHLVAVTRLLIEHGEDGRTDVAALCPSSVRPRRAERGSAPRPSPGRPWGAPSFPPASHRDRLLLPAPARSGRVRLVVTRYIVTARVPTITRRMPSTALPCGAMGRRDRERIRTWGERLVSEHGSAVAQ